MPKRLWWNGSTERWKKDCIGISRPPIPFGSTINCLNSWKATMLPVIVPLGWLPKTWRGTMKKPFGNACTASGWNRNPSDPNFKWGIVSVSTKCMVPLRKVTCRVRPRECFWCIEWFAVPSPRTRFTSGMGPPCKAPFTTPICKKCSWRTTPCFA